MSVQPILEARKQELRRRVEGIPGEVANWKTRTLTAVDQNTHWSQLQAIGTLMDAFTQQQVDILNQLQTGGPLADFLTTSTQLVQKIISSQRAWDFFRDKLDLRFSPDFAPALYVADIVAWDCYRPVLEEAANAGILNSTELREPPLTYLTAEFSPATWMRGMRPNDGRDYILGTSRLPIPVIELPWDHVPNVWEFVALQHEVGHDLEADLKLRASLQVSLQDALTKKGVPKTRMTQWLAWLGEIFADQIGLQLGGPAFTEGLMSLLLLPEAQVTTYNQSDPHPTHYPRILMNAAYIPTLVPGDAALIAHSQAIADRWIAIYGKQPQFKHVLEDFPLVFKALMDTPLVELKGKRVRELMPYTAADDLRIRQAAEYLQTGINQPANLRPRHCVSAARLAVTDLADGSGLTPELLEQIHQRTTRLVRANAPDGLLAIDNSPAHKKFIAGFADQF